MRREVNPLERLFTFRTLDLHLWAAVLDMVSELLLGEAGVLLLIAHMARHAVTIVRFDELLELLYRELHHRPILHYTFVRNCWCTFVRILTRIYFVKFFCIELLQHRIWLARQILAVRTTRRLSHSHHRSRTLTQLHCFHPLFLMSDFDLARLAVYFVALLAF